MEGLLRYLVIGIALLLPTLAAAETTKPIRMRVVESGSGKPIPGAIVRYRAEAREGSLSGHGGRGAVMFDIRGESGADGTIALPPTQFNPRIFGLFGLNTNYENATMTIMRSGYETLELRNSRRIIPNLDEAIDWEYDGRTVELKPAREAPRASPASGAPVPQPTQIRRADDSLPQHRAAPIAR
jgi:hypothetical protein